MLAGSSINQTKDYGSDMNMEEFSHTRLEPIKLNRRVSKKDAASINLNETEKIQLRPHRLLELGGARGKTGRIRLGIDHPTKSDIPAANDVVAHLKTFPTTSRIHPIPGAKLRNILIADAAFDASGRDCSDGCLVQWPRPV